MLNEKDARIKRLKSNLTEILRGDYYVKNIHVNISRLEYHDLESVREVGDYGFEYDSIPFEEVSPILPLIKHIMDCDFDGDFNQARKLWEPKILIEHMCYFRFLGVYTNFILVDGGVPFVVSLQVSFWTYAAAIDIGELFKTSGGKMRKKVLEMQRELLYETYIEHKVQQKLIELL